MFTTLRSRLWLTYAVLIGLILFVIGVRLVIFLIRNSPSSTRSYQGLQIISAALTRRPRLLIEGRLADAIPQLNQLDSAFDVRIIVLDSNGGVLVDTRSAAEPAIPQSTIHTVITAKVEKPTARQQFRDSNGTVWLFISRHIEDNEALIVATHRPMGTLRQILREDLIPPLLQAGLGAAVIAILLAIWLSHWMTNPLHKMTKSTQALAVGKHEPIKIEGPSEMRELARSFNTMSARVQSTQQSQRDFVANVSHDLKTPLTSIQGFAQAILDGTATQPDDLHKAAGVIYSEANRMNRMVLDLLELARMDAGIADFKRSPVDITNLLKGLIEKLSPQASQAQVKIRAELGPLPLLSGDEDRLIQAFTNIVDNALKFSPQHGEVLIRAGQAAGIIEVSVSDAGPGIPADDLPHLFDRFYQTDKSRRREGRGSGLGLSIAKEIIQAHHGTITVQSQSGKGSTFIVTLPVSE